MTQQQTRRRMLTVVGATAVMAPAIVRAQTPPASPPAPAAPATTITNPPRDFSPRGAPTTYFRDPDVLTIDPAFNGIAQPNAAIQRLWTGALWSEGPAWNAQGRYLVGADGAIEGGDASDDLVRDLQTLGREKLADAVRDTAR